MVEPIDDHVVSMPAISSSAHMPITTSLGDRLAVVLGLEQFADEVVGRLGLALGDRLLQVLDDPDDAAAAALGVVGELEHVAHPLGEGAGHRLGHAEDVADHPHRDLLGVLRGSVALAASDDVVDEAAAQLAGEHLVLGHPGRAHRRQHESPGPGVQRRVGADRRHARGEHRRRSAPARGSVGADVDHRHDADAVAGRELLDVVRDRVHVGVARGQPRPAPPVGVRHRARLAEFVPDGVGVGDVLRVEDVVVARPVGHGGRHRGTGRCVVAHCEPPTRASRP